MEITCMEIEFGTPEHSESVVLRDQVLRKPLGIEFTVEQLADEWNEIHLVAFDDNMKIVGVLLLRPLTKEIIKMRQVAVHPDLHGKGIGKQLVLFSEAYASKAGYKKMELNARDIAIPFYETMQYNKIGDEFEEVSIKHYKMEKKL